MLPNKHYKGHTWDAEFVLMDLVNPRAAGENTCHVWWQFAIHLEK